MGGFTPPPGLRPWTPHAFGLNPPTQLVIGYHWFAFLNQIRKNLFQVPDQFTTNVDYKIDYISKTINRTKKNSRTQTSVSEHSASFEPTFFFTFSVSINI